MTSSEIKPQVIRPSANPELYLNQLADIFSRSWTEQAAINIDRQVADIQVIASLPNTYALVDENHPETILTQVHTVPATVLAKGQIGMIEFLRLFPNYHQVKKHAADLAAATTNLIICYSVNSGNDSRKIDDTPKPIWLIKHLPVPADVRKIAYSFMTQPDVSGLLDHLNKPRELGPVGLHLYKGGAIPFAIINNSRPGHQKAFNNNTLMAYPKNPDEAALFENIVARWQTNHQIPNETIKLEAASAVLFTDIAGLIF